MRLYVELRKGEVIDGRLRSETHELEMHPCNEGDVFFPPDTRIEDSSKYTFEVSYCLNGLEDIELWGNHESTNLSQLSVRVLKCKDRPTCKSDDEIDAFIDNSILTVLRNNQIYQS